MRKTVSLCLLFILLVILPFALARHLLTVTRAEVVMGDKPNYLAHIQPVKGDNTLANRLSRIVDQEVRTGVAVPRIFFARLPDTLPDIKNAHKRKLVFTSVLLPVVLRANELILVDRARLLDLRYKLASGVRLRQAEQDWLLTKARQYRLKKRRDFNIFDIDKLLRRVDIIPPSLALAQAAMESGWGSSYFAQEGNALFGEWVWGKTTDGIVPRGREDGKTHKIKKFDYLIDSVLSYMTNLNRHDRYTELRDRRAELRELNLNVTGPALAPALIGYSERGSAYVSDILSIINYNGLESLDAARLARHETG